MPSSLPPYEPQPSYLRSLMHDYHQQINAQVDATVSDLQQRWVAARAAINADIARLQQQMETAIANGDQITYAWLADAQRLAALKASVEGNIAQFAEATRQLVADGQLSALDLGTNAAQETLAATVPPGLSYTFGVPPADVLHAQAGALSPTSPLTALFAQLGPDAAKSAQAALFTSVALGEGPRAAATRLFWNTNLPRQRAEVIARTEILRSWRGAQMENYRANQDVVSGWMWSADFSDRTCFPAGTLIQTRQGPIPIEQVRVGDDALTHSGHYRPVFDVMAREYRGEMVTLTAARASNAWAPVANITATADHPFLIEHARGPQQGKREWMEAANIRAGTTVVMADGLATVVFSYYSDDPETTVTVYNLEVAEDHSYFANGYAVHNCGACIAMDGTIHTLDEDLDDHIMGRCSALPITKPWSDILAGTGADTSGLTETSIASWDSYLHGNGFAADWFDGLAPEVQNSILGPAKAEAYRQGDLDLKQLAGVRHDPVWGDSIQEVSLKQLGLDAQDYLAAARANGTDSVVADAEALAQAAEGTPAAMAEATAKAEQSTVAMSTPPPLAPELAPEVGSPLVAPALTEADINWDTYQTFDNENVNETFTVQSKDGVTYFGKRAEEAEQAFQLAAQSIYEALGAQDAIVEGVALGDVSTPPFVTTIYPFVENTSLLQMEMDEQMAAIHNGLSETDAWRLQIGAWLMGDQDRHMGQFIQLADGRVLAVDFGRAFIGKGVQDLSGSMLPYWYGIDPTIDSDQLYALTIPRELLDAAAAHADDLAAAFPTGYGDQESNVGAVITEADARMSYLIRLQALQEAAQMPNPTYEDLTDTASRLWRARPK